jgi:peptide/nickel transport system substrate-binding protein
VQRGIAHDIQTLLLDETPVIFAYFYNYLVATSAAVSGVQSSAISQLYLQNATIS